MLTFLSSPLFRAGLIVAFIGFVFGSGYLLGKRMADQTARIAELERDARDLKVDRDIARAQRDEVLRQAVAARDIAAVASKREQEAQAENDVLADMLKKSEEARKASDSRVCLPDHGAAERLRDIHDRALGTE